MPRWLAVISSVRRGPCRRGRATVLLAAALLAVLALAPARALAATVTPTRLDDPPGAGSCPLDCSLRQAIAAAGPGGTVSLASPAPSGTYTLTLGPLALTSPVTIAGPGAGTTTISGAGKVQLITIAAGVRVSISGVTLASGVDQNGTSGGSGGAIASAGVLTLSGVNLEHNVAAGGVPSEKTFAGGGGHGGAIYNSGLLTVLGGAFVANTAEGGSSKFGKETTEFDGSSGQGGAIASPGTLLVRGATFTGNAALAGGAGTTFGSYGADGGAIDSSGSIRIYDSVLSANKAGAGSEGGGEGGAIESNSSLALLRSTLSGNVAEGVGAQRGEGGALELGGAARIEQSTLSGNSATGTTSEGGAIQAYAALSLVASTLTGNSAANGGAIENEVNLEALNTTITGNTATQKGGALINYGTAGLASDTIVANGAAKEGGGNIYSYGAALLAHDTIVAQGAVSGGSGGENCAGPGGYVSAGYNLEDRNQCGFTGPGDLVNVASPLLGPLAGNGGPTATIALLTGSPAVDAGDPAGCTDQLGEPLAGDQRGVARPQGARCDIGAYELVPPPVPQPQPQPQPQPPLAQLPATPALSALKVKPSSFRAAASGATIAATSKHARGARIVYTDSLAATTSLTIVRSARGVRSGKRCVAPPRRRRAHAKLKSCRRRITLATVRHSDRAGTNSLRFSGRVHGHKLAPGLYTLRATPSLAGRTGRTLSARFHILR